MKKIKKLCLFSFIILFLASIHHDLTTGTGLQTDVKNQYQQSGKSLKITAIQVKVQAGDTVLSIVERLSDQNQSIDQQNVQRIMTDFKTLNPDTPPLEIQEGNYYYFPLYKNERVSLSISRSTKQNTKFLSLS